jgi:hypothetical protein
MHNVNMTMCLGVIMTAVIWITAYYPVYPEMNASQLQSYACWKMWNFFSLLLHGSHDNSVSVVTALQGKQLRIRGSVLVGDRIFLFSVGPRSALGSTQPLIQWVLGSLSSWAKRPGYESAHSPPSSAKLGMHRQGCAIAQVATCQLPITVAPG